MTDQEFREQILQRLTRLEEQVTNHLPHQIGELRSEIRGFRTQFWGGIVIVLAAGLGFNYWLVQRLIEFGALVR